MFARNIDAEKLQLEKLQLAESISQIDSILKPQMLVAATPDDSHPANEINDFKWVRYLSTLPAEKILTLIDQLVSDTNIDVILYSIHTSDFISAKYTQSDWDYYNAENLLIDIAYLISMNDYVEIAKSFLTYRFSLGIEYKIESIAIIHGAINIFNDIIKPKLTPALATVCLVRLFETAISNEVLFPAQEHKSFLETYPLVILTIDRLLEYSENYSHMIHSFIQAGANPHHKTKHTVVQSQNGLVTVYEYCEEMSSPPHIEYQFYDKLIELQTKPTFMNLFQGPLSIPVPLEREIEIKRNPGLYFAEAHHDIIRTIALCLTPIDITFRLIPAVLIPKPESIIPAPSSTTWPSITPTHDDMTNSFTEAILDKATCKKLVKRHYKEISLKATVAARKRTTDRITPHRNINKYRFLFSQLHTEEIKNDRLQIENKYDKLFQNIELNDVDEVIANFKNGRYVTNDLFVRKVEKDLGSYHYYADMVVIEVAAKVGNQRLLDFFYKLISKNNTELNYVFETYNHLHFAVLCNQEILIKALVAIFNIDKMTYYEDTPLMIAIKFGRTTIADTLLALGATPATTHTLGM